MSKSVYSVAAHTYFHVLNKVEQREQFLAGVIQAPAFTYGADYDKSKVSSRMAESAGGTWEYRSLSLVYYSILLSEQPSQSSLEQFRSANVMLYGEPDFGYVDELLLRIKGRVSKSTLGLWEYIENQLGDINETGLKQLPPEDSVFQKYREHFMRYLGFDITDVASMGCQELIEYLLTKTELVQSGWHLVQIDDASHARVSHTRKQVIIGRNYKTATARSPLRIAVHEVIGHALRGGRSSISESEGFAIVLEQLIDDRFKPRRVYRYLAAALGWGVHGKRMNFREVYEIIWRLMVVRSGYSEAKAQVRAFDECARVFRGGLPRLAGAVYLKDMVYLTANLKIWSLLSEQVLNYEQFVDVIEGRNEVL